MIRRALLLSFWFLLCLRPLPAQQATPPSYTLKPTPKTVAWGYYDAKPAPVLRVKSGDTFNTQTPNASTAAQEEKHPIIYIKHLEPPSYPPLPRITRVSGTIEMHLKIGADGAVLSIESVPIGLGGTVLTMLKDAAEKNVKTWTFGCASCPPDAPFEHTIKFIYGLDDSLADSACRTVMDLPDKATISCGPTMIDHGGPPPKKSKKGRS